METAVHTLKLRLNWKLINLISQIDRFDASWTSIEKKEGQSKRILAELLKQNLIQKHGVGPGTNYSIS